MVNVKQPVMPLVLVQNAMIKPRATLVEQEEPVMLIVNASAKFFPVAMGPVMWLEENVAVVQMIVQ